MFAVFDLDAPFEGVVALSLGDPQSSLVVLQFNFFFSR